MTITGKLLQAHLERLETGQLDAGEPLGSRLEDEELRLLLSVAERYRNAPAVQPSLVFRQAARGRMLNLIAVSDASRRSSRSLLAPGWRYFVRLRMGPIRVAAALAVVLALLAGGGTAVMAAASSSPLFAARLTLEEAQVFLTPGQVGRAELRWEIAERRARDLVDSLELADAPAVDIRYQDALSLAVQADAGDPTDLDRRLAEQEAMLRGASIGEGSAPGATRLESALQAVESERRRLRLRNGGDSSSPATESSSEPAAPAAASPTPTSLSTSPSVESWQIDGGLSEPERRQERGGEPAPNPEATPGAAPSTPDSWVSPEPERNRQQGVAPSSPVDPTATPTRSGGQNDSSGPKATPSGPETGGPKGPQGSGADAGGR